MMEVGCEVFGFYYECKDEMCNIGFGFEYDWLSYVVDVFGLMVICYEQLGRVVVFYWFICYVDQGWV